MYNIYHQYRSNKKYQHKLRNWFRQHGGSFKIVGKHYVGFEPYLIPEAAIEMYWNNKYITTIYFMGVIEFRWALQREVVCVIEALKKAGC